MSSEKSKIRIRKVLIKGKDTEVISRHLCLVIFESDLDNFREELKVEYKHLEPISINIDYEQYS
jgi:hypothetical protein